MSGPIAAPTTWKFSKRMFCTTPLGGVSRDSSEGRGGEGTNHPPPRGRPALSYED